MLGGADVTARERLKSEVFEVAEETGHYRVAVLVRFAPGHRGAALRALAHVLIDVLVKARKEPE